MTAEGILVETQTVAQPPLLAWAEVRSIRLGATVGRSALLFWSNLGAPIPFVEFAMADGRRLPFRFPVAHEDFLRFAATLLEFARPHGATAPLIVLSDGRFYRIFRGGVCVAVSAIAVAATVIAVLWGSLGGALLAAAFAALLTWPAWLFVRDLRSRPVAVGDRAEDVLRRLRLRLS